MPIPYVPSTIRNYRHGPVGLKNPTDEDTPVVKAWSDEITWQFVPVPNKPGIYYIRVFNVNFQPDLRFAEPVKEILYANRSRPAKEKEWYVLELLCPDAIIILNVENWARWELESCKIGTEVQVKGGSDNLAPAFKKLVESAKDGKIGNLPAEIPTGDFLWIIFPNTSPIPEGPVTLRNKKHGTVALRNPKESDTPVVKVADEIRWQFERVSSDTYYIRVWKVGAQQDVRYTQVQDKDLLVNTSKPAREDQWFVSSLGDDFEERIISRSDDHAYWELLSDKAGTKVRVLGSDRDDAAEREKAKKLGQSKLGLLSEADQAKLTESRNNIWLFYDSNGNLIRGRIPTDAPIIIRNCEYGDIGLRDPTEELTPVIKVNLEEKIQWQFHLQPQHGTYHIIVSKDGFNEDIRYPKAQNHILYATKESSAKEQEWLVSWNVPSGAIVINQANTLGYWVLESSLIDREVEVRGGEYPPNLPPKNYPPVSTDVDSGLLWVIIPEPRFVPVK